MAWALITSLLLVAPASAGFDAGLTSDAGSTDSGAADAGLDAGPSDAPDPTWAMASVLRTTAGEYVEQLLEDGRHVRFGTADAGAVQVWKPAYYRPDSAGWVIYLHGFYTDADTAFLEHKLATQFRDSGRNALFVVPETRSWRTDPLFWPKLEELLEAVRKKVKTKMPQGPVTVVAHSGGYRTVAEWLKHPKLNKLILLDALYGSDADFLKWTMQPGPHQLVMVGFDTAQRSEWFLKKTPVALRLDDLPYVYDTLPPQQAMAPVLYLQSERFDHMGIVTEGRVVPYLLHALP